jgi:hypothetical protein
MINRAADCAVETVCNPVQGHCTSKVCRDECIAEKVKHNYKYYRPRCEKPANANKPEECCCSFYRVVVPPAADDEIRG